MIQGIPEELFLIFLKKCTKKQFYHYKWVLIRTISVKKKFWKQSHLLSPERQTEDISRLQKGHDVWPRSRWCKRDERIMSKVDEWKDARTNDQEREVEHEWERHREGGGMDGVRGRGREKCPRFPWCVLEREIKPSRSTQEQTKHTETPVL